jgi:hypothetical protein
MWQWLFNWVAQPIINALATLWSKIWQFLSALGVWLIQNIIQPTMAWLLQILQAAMAFLLDMIGVVLTIVVQAVSALLPNVEAADMLAHLDTLRGYYDMASWFIPVNACLTIWFVFFAIIMTIRMIRFVLKIAPFVG